MDKCPACERKFEEIKDFPITEIVKFKRLKIPEIIMTGISDLIAEKNM